MSSVVERLTRSARRSGRTVEPRRLVSVVGPRPARWIGDGIEVIALTSVAANLAAILGGIIVFHDPIGSGPAGITARFLAFCLVIAGAALMPGPMCATPHAR